MTKINTTTDEKTYQFTTPITDAVESFEVYSAAKSNTEKYKRSYRALDFSSVGLGNSKDGLKFRRYHQMTLYIYDLPSEEGFGNTKGSNFVIASNLPETFTYSIGSEYEAPFNRFGSGLTNLVAQIATNGEYSSTLRAGSVKIWAGGKPLSFSVTIPVVDDAFEGDIGNGFSTNFMESLEVLGRMCLPRLATEAKPIKGEKNKFKYILSKVGALKPPPTPARLDVTYDTDKKEILDNGKEVAITANKPIASTGRIDVQLGGMLLVQNCILEGMNITYDNTKTMIKHDYSRANTYAEKKEFLTPMTAKLTLNFSTVTLLTSQAYTDMLWLKSGETSANRQAPAFKLDATGIPFKRQE